ncbi:MAG: OmpA family protein [Lentimicrobiaceae bacterium]|nr:OmpA family protein [Lentimicrobiaceae bacterium]
MKQQGVFLILFFWWQGWNFAAAQAPPPVQRDTLRIYFDLNKADLSSESKKILDTLLRIPQMKAVRITAYTDFLGGGEQNLALSQKRSENTKSYLLEKQFPADKIMLCQGLGVHQNSSEANRTNKQDKGIREHRLVEVVYVFEKPKPISNLIDTNKKTIIREEDIEVGSNLRLENIIFYSNMSKLVPGAEQYLYQLLDIMQKYPNLKIEIQGHICCRPAGQDAYDNVRKNDFLSVNRARVVYLFLVKNGIDKSRMTYAGFGSSQKIFPEEKTKQEQEQNRRVEIKIIEK